MVTERSIVEAAARLRRHGEPYLVATVVSTSGTAYRRPGARMVLTRFRWVAGTVTGGVLEGELSNTGWQKTKDAPLLVRYDAADGVGAEDDDIRSAFGLGCDGSVEVLVERAGMPGRIDALEVAARCYRAQKRAAVVTVYRSNVAGVRVGSRMAALAGGELELEADPIEPVLRGSIEADLRIVLESGVSATRTYQTPDGSTDVLIEAVVPPVRLFVFGTGHDAVPLAQLAHQIGWEVVICTTGTTEIKYSTRERFVNAVEMLTGTPAEIAARIDETERAVAVVMSHDVAREREHLGMLLVTRARHIAVLGPKQRALEMLTALERPDDARIHGIDQGETPQELALTAIAQAQATIALPRMREQTTPHVERPTASRPAEMFAAIAAI
ncbi:MAG: XdhC family protein [Deltaproteobacteria bacterium]|nr:XdhC family protein [Deltaproteobacteria bacterium]